MKKLTFVAAAFAALISLGSTAQADIIYAENADGLTAGSDTLGDSTDWNGTASEYDVLAAGTAFGTNHFELNGPASNFTFANWEPAAPFDAVQTFSIDLADTGGGGTNADAGVRIAARRTSGSTFFDVTALSLTDNTASTFHVVVNNSAAAVTYEDGVTTLAAGAADLWQDGTLVNTKTTLGGSGDVFSWGLWGRRTDNAMLGDNIEIRNTAFNGTVAAVPEPSSVVLLGLVGLAGLVRRKNA